MEVLLTTVRCATCDKPLVLAMSEETVFFASCDICGNAEFLFTVIVDAILAMETLKSENKNKK